MNRSLKKWAIMVLLASAFIISARSGFLLAIGALGVFAGANMMIQVEEKH